MLPPVTVETGQNWPKDWCTDLLKCQEAQSDMLVSTYYLKWVERPRVKQVDASSTLRRHIYPISLAELAHTEKRHLV
jgi:hypothetical protein